MVRTNRRWFDDSVDIKSVLDSSKWHKLDYFQGVTESSCSIIEVNGKYGLGLGDHKLCKPEYEQIFRLTYAHYLCAKHTSYTLYEWKSYEDLNLLATLTIKGDVTPRRVMSMLLESHSDVYHELSKLLYENLNGKWFVSHYRDFEGRVGYDIFFTVAVQRVIMFDDFGTAPFDVIGYLAK